MRVAIVSYYTPPQSAIASHRVLRLTRCLLAAGHDVHWVTSDPDRISASSLDPSLGAMVPAEVQMVSERHGGDMLLDADTYGRRSSRSARLPGALIDDFTFTL